MNQKGFTLIEMLIAVVIVAILAAVALPSYQDSVNRSRRADGMAALMGLAQAMERHFTQNNTYVGASNTVTNVPLIYADQAPLDGNDKYYNLRITTETATTYTLQAQPINAQTGDGTLQLTHVGQRVWDRDNDGNLTETSDLCWETTC